MKWYIIFFSCIILIQFLNIMYWSVIFLFLLRGLTDLCKFDRTQLIKQYGPETYLECLCSPLSFLNANLSIHIFYFVLYIGLHLHFSRNLSIPFRFSNLPVTRKVTTVLQQSSFHPTLYLKPSIKINTLIVKTNVFSTLKEILVNFKSNRRHFIIILDWFSSFTS